MCTASSLSRHHEGAPILDTIATSYLPPKPIQGQREYLRASCQLAWKHGKFLQHHWFAIRIAGASGLFGRWVRRACALRAVACGYGSGSENGA